VHLSHLLVARPQRRGDARQGVEFRLQRAPRCGLGLQPRMEPIRRRIGARRVEM
jgi:hypothetical protein